MHNFLLGLIGHFDLLKDIQWKAVNQDGCIGINRKAYRIGMCSLQWSALDTPGINGRVHGRTRYSPHYMSTTKPNKRYTSSGGLPMGIHILANHYTNYITRVGQNHTCLLTSLTSTHASSRTGCRGWINVSTQALRDTHLTHCAMLLPFQGIKIFRHK